MDLSVLIPARNEMFLAKTVEDVLAHARGETEVIVVLDGAWADPPIADHPRVTVLHRPEAVGQRAATNLAAKLSTARYVMKLDGHCSVADGFDVDLV
jgi:glycosyltransferase involved in cell wall biosynthesis